MQRLCGDALEYWSERVGPTFDGYFDKAAHTNRGGEKKKNLQSKVKQKCASLGFVSYLALYYIYLLLVFFLFFFFV